MRQRSLFDPESNEPEAKPLGDAPAELTVLITVKAAPNPSEKYGETVCVAGIRADLNRPGWVRLYPINFRALDSDETFAKYDIVRLSVIPARGDQRRESWRPRMQGIQRLQHLGPWKPRRAWLDGYIEDSMCERNRAVKERHDAPSLALVSPKEVDGLEIERHPGWTFDEQRKIDAYVNQLDLLDDTDRTPLQPPRFKGFYRYRCHDRLCSGHRQGLLDWEFVTLQRRLRGLPDDEAAAEIQRRFVGMMCSPKRDVAFFVGNQAKRVNVFSVLGVYYPER